jgi:hypothetical protein
LVTDDSLGIKLGGQFRHSVAELSNLDAQGLVGLGQGADLGLGVVQSNLEVVVVGGASVPVGGEIGNLLVEDVDLGSQLGVLLLEHDNSGGGGGELRLESGAVGTSTIELSGEVGHGTVQMGDLVGEIHDSGFERSNLLGEAINGNLKTGALVFRGVQFSSDFSKECIQLSHLSVELGVGFDEGDFVGLESFHSGLEVSDINHGLVVESSHVNSILLLGGELAGQLLVGGLEGGDFQKGSFEFSLEGIGSMISGGKLGSDI